MKYLLPALFAVALVGCQPEKSADVPAAPAAPAVPVVEPTPAPVVDMHTSRNALDWSGTYEGLLACADCVGIHARLILESDDHFEIATRRLVRDAAPSSARGQFDWEVGDNSIVFTTEEGPQRFAVGEGRLLLLESGQTQPAWDRRGAILPQSSPDWRSSREGLGEMIEDHRWTLVDAHDGANQHLGALFPDPERGFAFNFDGLRLHVQGGCNGLRGAYRIDADGMLEVTGRMSTRMACEAPLMEADAALSALMAEPLETVLIRGAQPTLVLLASTGDALVLRGELTHEARFGAPARVFLEVAAQTVPCEAGARGDGQCLQVRERTFDEQGLLVGEPSEWQIFTAEIEGYRHEPGIRNVLRINRFQPEPAPGVPAGALHVLDMIVQSEIVTE